MQITFLQVLLPDTISFCTGLWLLQA